ncbi:MAG: WbqC family protein [Planctomycetota bacterium]
MKLAIMQPYILPYIGYFQLIRSVDTFVVYDNIKYTKKGWINRNRFLRDGQDILFSLPLTKASDFLDIREREISEAFDRKQLLDQIANAYRKAPYGKSALGLLETILACEDRNLFRFLLHSLQKTCDHLGITTKFVISSTLEIDHELKSEQKVLAICKALRASHYINAIGGQELYAKEQFTAEGLTLSFIKSRPIEYAQLGQPFVPWLSILDVIAFNAPDAITGFLTEQYDLI